MIYTSSSNSTGISIIEPWPNLSGAGFDYIHTTSTTSTRNTFKVDIKRCRNCSHAHMEGQQGCIDAIGGMVYFTTCTCQEYIPTDNLEYLEWLDKKKNG